MNRRTEAGENVAGNDYGRFPADVNSYAEAAERDER